MVVFIKNIFKKIFISIAVVFCFSIVSACNKENDYSYTVTIASSIDGAFNFEGETTQIIDSNNPEFKDVKIVSNFGYSYKYYEVDGIKYVSDVISMDNINSNKQIVVYADYQTYELPIININTNGEEINSKEEYTDMEFSITNCEEPLNNVTGGIRLRGNSTKGYPKKPYRIKFDKKQSLFGLEKAKSWVLLADWLDPSALHNYTAFSLASQLDGLAFTPTPHKVNVYLNGEFVGLYTLCEQVQENEGRMNIEIDITEEMTDLKDFNFFFAMDYSVHGDPGAILNETYFYIEEYDRYFELKYPEKSQFVSEEQFESFFDQLKTYTKYLLDTFKEKNLEKIQEEVNVNSLVDYLIVDEIMGEGDHSYKSFNMYYTNTSEDENENNKINFGPVWDYDWALFTPWDGEPNDSYYVSDNMNYSNVFFQAVEGIPELFDVLVDRYQTCGSKVLHDYIISLYQIESEIRDSIYLNEQKWYLNYEKDISKNNINFLNKFLLNRKTLLDKLWSSN